MNNASFNPPCSSPSPSPLVLSRAPTPAATMASPQQVRMITTKAQRSDAPLQPLTRANTFVHGTATVGDDSQYILPQSPSGSSSCMFPSPPQYQEPPANMKPLYYGGKDIETSTSTKYDHYPPSDPGYAQVKRLILTKSKLPFWRTKKGIALIVLLSNVIMLAIVLGAIFGSRSNQQPHGHPSWRRPIDQPNSAGDNPEGSSPSESNPSPGSDQHAVASAGSTMTSSVNPTSPSSSGPLSTHSSSIRTAVPSAPTGAPQAAGNGNGANSGAEPPVTGAVETGGPRVAPGAG
ncbi:hypothetical protein AN958_10696 [Leucoagaricus sp. SymC.cos]|nr:hypothetical protein AN958_10696 [Leucoagaricus sp. SymC.cos]